MSLRVNQSAAGLRAIALVAILAASAVPIAPAVPLDAESFADAASAASAAGVPGSLAAASALAADAAADSDLPTTTAAPDGPSPEDILRSALLAVRRPYYAALAGAPLPEWAGDYAWQVAGIRNPVLDPGFEAPAAALWTLDGSRADGGALVLPPGATATQAFPNAAVPRDDALFTNGGTTVSGVSGLRAVVFRAEGEGFVTVTLRSPYTGDFFETDPAPFGNGINRISLDAFAPRLEGENADVAHVTEIGFVGGSAEARVDDVVLDADLGDPRAPVGRDSAGGAAAAVAGAVGGSDAALADVLAPLAGALAAANDGLSVLVMPTAEGALIAALVEHGPSGSRVLAPDAATAALEAFVAPPLAGSIAPPPASVAAERVVALADTAYASLLAEAGLSGEAAAFPPLDDDGVLAWRVTLAACEPSLYLDGAACSGGASATGYLNLLKLTDPANPANDALDAFPDAAAAAAGPALFADLDGDGYTDDVETRLLSSPDDAGDVPARDPALGHVVTAEALRAAGFAKIDEVRYPLATFPAFLAPGETLTIELNASERPADVAVRATPTVGAFRAEKAFELAVVDVSDVAYATERWPDGGFRAWRVNVTLPEGFEADRLDRLYGLNLSWGGGAEWDEQPRALKLVSAYKAQPLVAVIADPQVGDPRALQDAVESGNPEMVTFTLSTYTGDPTTLGDEWTAFRRVVQEINLLDPDFVVLAGDLGFGQAVPGSYHVEYEDAYEILNGLHAPVFPSVGNHDGYAANGEDGFAFWEAYFGPLYYSFDYGDVHGFALNTYDWAYVDRLGVSTAVSTWGGQVRKAQFEWLERDIEAHADATYSFGFGHHSPSWAQDAWQDADVEDALAFPFLSQEPSDYWHWWSDFFGAIGRYVPAPLDFPFKGLAGATYLAPGHGGAGDQEWTGENRLELRALFRERGVDAFLAGHTHVDRVAQELPDGRVIEADGHHVHYVTPDGERHEASLEDFDFEDPERILYVETVTTSSGTDQYWGYRLLDLGSAVFGYHPRAERLAALTNDPSFNASHAAVGLFSIPASQFEVGEEAAANGEKNANATSRLDEALRVVVRLLFPEEPGGVAVARSPRGAGLDVNATVLREWSNGTVREVDVAFDAAAAPDATRASLTRALAYIDSAAPTTSLAPLGEWSLQPTLQVLVDGAEDDHDGADVLVDVEFRHRPPAGEWTPWTPLATDLRDGAVVALDPADFGDGYYEFRSRGRDYAGNVESAAKAADAVTKRDLTPPEVTVSLPEPQGLAGWFVETPTLDVVATDAFSIVSLVEYCDGAACPESGWRPYTGPLDLPDGARTVHARAVDRVGNVAPVVAIPVKVDTVEPTLPDVHLQDATGRSADPERITSSLTVELHAHEPASDATSGVLYAWNTEGAPPAVDDDAAWATGLPHEFTFAGTDQSTLHVFVRDVAGNLNESSAPAAITVDLDAPTPPAVALRDVAPLSSDPRNVTNGLTVELIVDAPAVDDSGGLRYFVGEAAEEPPALEDVAAWALALPADVTLGGEGSREVRVFVRDDAGNLGDVAVARILADTTPPTPPRVALRDRAPHSADPANLTNSLDVALLTLAPAADAATGVSFAWRESDDAPAPDDADAWADAVPARVVLSGEGERALRVFVRDGAGNVAGPATARITVDLTAPEAPTAVVADPTSGSTEFTNDGLVTLDLAHPDERDVAAWYVAEADPLFRPAEDAPGWSSAKPTTFALSVGDAAKAVRAWVRDAAGNVLGFPAVATITLDTAPPATPGAFAVRDPATESTSLTNRLDAPVEFAIPPGAVAFLLRADDAARPAEDDAAWTAAAPERLALPEDAADGPHEARLWVKDAAGNLNVRAAVAAFTLDRAPPAAPASLVVRDPVTGSTTLTNAVHPAIDFEAPADVAFFFVRVDDAAAPDPADAAWTREWPTEVDLGDHHEGDVGALHDEHDDGGDGGDGDHGDAAEGQRTVYLWVKDEAWNVNATPASATITLDTTAPEAPHLTLRDAATESAAYALAPDVLVDIEHDEDAVAWLLTEEHDAPHADDARWLTERPSAFALSDGEGAKAVHLWTKDEAGNVGDAAEATITLDLAPPATTHATSATEGEDGWLVTAASVAFSATDAASGVARTEHSLDGGATWTPVSGPVLVSALGETRLLYRSVDAAGRVEDAREATLRIDSVVPTTAFALDGTGGAAGWWKTPVTVALTASGGPSGVTTAYGVDAPADVAYEAPFVVGEDGRHEVRYASRSGAGLAHEETVLRVAVDATPPTTAAAVEGVLGENGWYTSPVTVTLVAEDATSGVDATIYEVGRSIITYDGPFVVGATDDHTLTYWARDVAGNAEAERALALPIDTERPIVTIATTPAVGDGVDGWFLTSPTVTLAATDEGSGVAAVEYRVGDGAWTTYEAPFPLPDGEWSVAARVRDLAGNAGDEAHATIRVDTVPPIAPPFGLRDLAPLSSDPDAITNRPEVALVLADDAAPLEPGVLFAWDEREDFVPGSTGWRPLPERVTLTPGEHVLRLYARDAAGNVAGPTTASMVVDLTPPTSPAFAVTDATSGARYHTNARDVDLAVVGAAADAHAWFVAESDEQLPDPPAEDDPRWTHAAPSAFTLTEAEGHRFIVLFVKDAAGNVAATPQNDQMDLDVTPPTPGPLRLHDRGTHSTEFAREAEVDVNVPERSADATAWILTEDADAAPPAEGDSRWRSVADLSFTLSHGDGLKTVRAWAKDVAGNVAPEPAVASITLDTTPPSASGFVLRDVETENDALTRSPTVAVEGTLVGAAAYRLTLTDEEPEEWTESDALPATFHFGDLPDGPIEARLWVRDAAGNAALAARASITLDQTPPELPVVRLESLDARASPGLTNATTVRLVVETPATDALSGGIEYQVHAGGEPLGWSSSLPSTLQIAPEQGEHVVLVGVRDAAGNENASAEARIVLDRASPAVSAVARDTLTGSTRYTGSQKITLDIASDDDAVAWLVAHDDARPTLDDARWSATPPASASLPHGDGEKTVRVWTRDGALNVGGPALARIVLDTAIETPRLIVPPFVPDRDVPVTYEALAPDVAAARLEEVPADGELPHAEAPDGLALPNGIVVSGGDGVKRIRLVVADRAGNVADATAITLLDTVAPSVSSWNGPTEVLVHVPMEFSAPPATDAGSGVAAYSWWFGPDRAAEGEIVKVAFPSTGTRVAYLNVTDGAGNAASISFTLRVHPPPPPARPTPTPPPASSTPPAGAEPPAASFEAPESALVGEAVRLDARASAAGRGDRLIAHEWDLGDGAAAAGSVIDYVWDEPGTYTVTLTVKAERGGSDTVGRAITVTAPATTPPPPSPPTPTPRDPLATARAPEGVVASPHELTFDVADGAIVRWRVAGESAYRDGPTARIEGDGLVTVQYFGEAADGTRDAARSVTLRLDASAPTVSDVAFATDGSPAPGEAVTVSARARDAQLVRVLAVVTGPAGSESVTLELALGGDGLHRASFTPSAPGSYGVRVVARDALGREGAASAAEALVVPEPLEPTGRDPDAPGDDIGSDPAANASGDPAPDAPPSPSKRVPAPAAVAALLAIGLVALALARRRR